MGIRDRLESNEDTVAITSTPLGRGRIVTASSRRQPGALDADSENSDSANLAGLEWPKTPANTKEDPDRIFRKMNAWRKVPLEKTSTKDDEEQCKEEDRWRLNKNVAEIMKRKREAKELSMQAAEEMERRKVQRQADADAAKGPYTYDLEGRIIWIRPPLVELLPDTIDSVLFDAGERDEFSLPKSTIDSGGSPTSPQISKSRRSAVQLSPDSVRGRRGSMLASKRQSVLNRGNSAPHRFTDGVCTSESKQPSLLDTMAVQPGVVLECMELKKIGSKVETTEDGHKLMTRREYIQMTKQEVGRKARPSTSTGNRRMSSSSTSSLLRPSSAPNNSAARGTEYSDADESRVEVGLHKPLQTAPPAPTWSLRVAKKAEVAHRGTRHHTATLGATHARGPSQPPLGATMGHGLMSDSSVRESFFFPDNGRTQDVGHVSSTKLKKR